jgi:hypothetical protein
VERSPDARHLHVISLAPLEPGKSYKLRIEADWHRPRLRLGNLALGGRREGRVVALYTFRAAELSPEAPALAVGPDETSAFEWTRPAIPIPTMLPSLNQIGFDYVDWIVGARAWARRTAAARARRCCWRSARAATPTARCRAIPTPRSCCRSRAACAAATSRWPTSASRWP